MKTQIKRHIAAARLISSTEGSLFAPEFLSRPRAGVGPSRALNVCEWTEGQSFSVRIIKSESVPANPAALEAPSGEFGARRQQSAESEIGVPTEKLGVRPLPGCTQAACAAALPLSFPGRFQYG